MRLDRLLPSSARGGYLAVALLGFGLTAGCITWFPENVVPPEAAFAPPPITQNNPVLIACQDGNLVFETVADVIDDYFKIDREVPVRTLADGLPIEGQIDTYPRGGSTLLEPWNRDSVNYYQRLESTLQSIRRHAHVQVIPPQSGQEGFLVHVEVMKELEDVARPEDGPASRAPNLRNDNSLRRYIDPVGGQQPTVGWISLGHDLWLATGNHRSDTSSLWNDAATSRYDSASRQYATARAGTSSKRCPANGRVPSNYSPAQCSAAFAAGIVLIQAWLLVRAKRRPTRL